MNRKLITYISTLILVIIPMMIMYYNNQDNNVKYVSSGIILIAVFLIILGTTPLSHVSTKSWRTLIGVVPQEVTIFNGNVIDNIRLGKEEKIENVLEFCREWGFETFINTLPQGYATVLGEEGINLSGGQKQLLAVIRALYKKPRLLILDEGTSAMDRDTEAFVWQLLNKLKKEMAIVMISHKLHTLKHIADTIYVIEKGKTVTSGNHEEFMETDNFYSRYWKSFL